MQAITSWLSCAGYAKITLWQCGSISNNEREKKDSLLHSDRCQIDIEVILENKAHRFTNFLKTPPNAVSLSNGLVQGSRASPRGVYKLYWRRFNPVIRTHTHEPSAFMWSFWERMM